MAYPIRHFLTVFGVRIADPLAFVVVGSYAILWLAFDRQSFDWHAAATMATWTMTLFIRRAEHRDTQAIQAKLDELLRAEAKARNELTSVDEKEPEEIEQLRDNAKGEKY
jgi:low affinity Fe/Cu permease